MPQVTTIPFNIRIIARDAANNVFPLNGAVSLRVRIGAADESADYIITNNSTFVNGQLDALVQVTKRGFSAYLIVDAGVVGESPAFQVNAGPCEKILMSFPGETWVNGLNDPNFSGNQGTPNAGHRRHGDHQHGDPAGGPLQQPGARLAQRDLQLPLGLVLDARLPGQRDDHQQLHQRPGDPALGRPDAVPAGPVQRHPGQRLQPGPGLARAPTRAWWSRPPARPSTRASSTASRTTARWATAAVQDAGVPFNVRVYATDAYWNPVSDFDPVLPLAMDFSSSDGAAVLPANPQSISDNNGRLPGHADHPGRPQPPDGAGRRQRQRRGRLRHHPAEGRRDRPLRHRHQQPHQPHAGRRADADPGPPGRLAAAERDGDRARHLRQPHQRLRRRRHPVREPRLGHPHPGHASTWAPAWAAAPTGAPGAGRSRSPAPAPACASSCARTPTPTPTAATPSRCSPRPRTTRT